MPVLSPRRHSTLSGSSYLPPSIGGTTSTATSSIIGERKSSIPSSISGGYGSSYRSTSLNSKPTSSLSSGYSTSGYSSGSSNTNSSSSYLRSPASYRYSLYNSSSALTGGSSYRYSTYGNYDTTPSTGITSGTSSRFGVSKSNSFNNKSIRYSRSSSDSRDTASSNLNKISNSNNSTHVNNNCNNSIPSLTSLNRQSRILLYKNRDHYDIDQATSKPITASSTTTTTKTCDENQEKANTNRSSLPLSSSSSLSKLNSATTKPSALSSSSSFSSSSTSSAIKNRTLKSKPPTYGGSNSSSNSCSNSNYVTLRTAHTKDLLNNLNSNNDNSNDNSNNSNNNHNNNNNLNNKLLLKKSLSFGQVTSYSSKSGDQSNNISNSTNNNNNSYNYSDKKSDSNNNDLYSSSSINKNNQNISNTSYTSNNSSLALQVATSGLDLYEKYSPAHYIPKCELSRSRSLSEATSNNNNNNSNSNGNGKTECSNNNDNNSSSTNYLNPNNLLSTTSSGGRNLKSPSPTPTATISLRKRSTYSAKNNNDDENSQRDNNDKETKSKDPKSKDEIDCNDAKIPTTTIKLKSRRNSDVKKTAVTVVEEASNDVNDKNDDTNGDLTATTRTTVKSYSSRKNSGNNNDDSLLSTSPTSKLSNSDSTSQLASKNKTQQSNPEELQQNQQELKLNSNNSNDFYDDTEILSDVIGSLTLHDNKRIYPTTAPIKITKSVNGSSSNPSSISSSPSSKQQQLNSGKNLTSVHKTQFSAYRDTNFLKTECELARLQLVKSNIAKFQQQHQHKSLDKATDDNSNNNCSNQLLNESSVSKIAATHNNNQSTSVQSKSVNHHCDNNNVSSAAITDNIKRQQQQRVAATSVTNRLYSNDYANVNRIGSCATNLSNSKLLLHHNSRTTKLSPLVHKTSERIASTTRQLLQQQKPKETIHTTAKSKTDADSLQSKQRQHQKQIVSNNNMNCFQNNSDLLDDIKFIDSDDSERHPATPPTQLTNSLQNSRLQQQQQSQKPKSVQSNATNSIAKQIAYKDNLSATANATGSCNHHSNNHSNHSSNLRFINSGSLPPSAPSAAHLKSSTLPIANTTKYRSQNLLASNVIAANHHSSGFSSAAGTLGCHTNIKYNTLNDFKRSSSNTPALLGSAALASTGKSSAIGIGNVRNSFNSINNSINKPILTSLKNSTVIVSSELNLNNENKINSNSSKKNYNINNATSSSSSSSLNCSPVPHQQQVPSAAAKYQLAQPQYTSSAASANYKGKFNSSAVPSAAVGATANLLRNNSCNSRESTPSSSPQLLKRNFNNSLLQQQHKQQFQQNNGSTGSLNSIGSASNLYSSSNSATYSTSQKQCNSQSYNAAQHTQQQTPKEIFFSGGGSRNSSGTSTPSQLVAAPTDAQNSTVDLLSSACGIAAAEVATSKGSTTTTVFITSNKENNVSNIQIKDAVGSTNSAKTTATDPKSQSIKNKCDGDESVRSTTLRSTLPSSPTPSRYWERETANGGRSSNRHMNNDNDDSGSSSYEKGGTEGLCGLRNIGNTCFMNSVIQCLSHTKELTKFLKTQTNSKSSTKDGQILYEFAKLIRDMWTTNVSSVTPMELKSAFSSKHRMYSGYNQQDAQEFLRFFLDSLHSALNNGVKGAELKIDDHLSDNKKADLTWEWYSRVENSLIRDLFVGQLKSTLRCTTCGNTSVTFDPFWDLSVPLPSSSRCKLESCLDLFIKEEVLDGDEMPTCAKCKTRRKCTKSFTIQRFPKYLVIHLKRFSETRWSKLSNIVEFPTGERELNMAPYASNSTNVYYSLYGISNHMGSTAGGHYVALCKHALSKKWHEFNDNVVSDELSESHLVSSSAYLLFFERACNSSNQSGASSSLSFGEQFDRLSGNEKIEFRNRLRQSYILFDANDQQHNDSNLACILNSIVAERPNQTNCNKSPIPSDNFIINTSLGILFYLIIFLCYFYLR